MNDLLPKPVDQLSVIEQAQSIVKLTALEKEIKQRLPELRAALLKALKENDVQQLKTGSYTISQAKRVTIRVEDQNKAIEFLNGKIPVVTKTVLDMDYMKPALEEIFEAGGEVEGIVNQVTEYPIVRLAKESK